MTTPDKQDHHTLKERAADATEASKKAAQQRPEAVQYMLLLWMAALIIEGFHQLLSIAVSLMNSDQLIAAVKRAAADRVKDSPDAQALPDGMTKLVAYGSVLFSALIAFLIIALLAYMLTQLANNTKRAGLGRRMWFAFSLYFGLRILFVFMTRPAGSDAPDWLIAGDGMLQIITGVAAVMGLIFSMREETLKHTGEWEEMKKLEAEMRERKAREDAEKAREKREQQAKEREEAARERAEEAKQRRSEEAKK